MKRVLFLSLVLASALRAEAKTIHCSDNANVLDFLRLEIDDKTLTGKVELKSRTVNKLPQQLLGIGPSSLGYVGLLTIQTPNLSCFLSKEAPEPISCWTGPNGAGNGNFSAVLVEGDTDLHISEIDAIGVTLDKNVVITGSGSEVSYTARISISKYNLSGPNRQFDEFFTFRHCAVQR